MKKNRFIVMFVLIIAIALANANMKSFALPGKTEPAFVQWAAVTPGVKGVKKVSAICSQQGGANYEKKANFNGLSLEFRAWFTCAANKKVKIESIYVSDSPFDAVRAKNFNMFLTDFFGTTIAKDFSLAKTVYAKKGMLNQAVYKGTYFVYSQMYNPEDGGFQFDIMPLNELQTAIEAAKIGEYGD